MDTHEHSLWDKFLINLKNVFPSSMGLANEKDWEISDDELLLFFFLISKLLRLADKKEMVGGTIESFGRRMQVLLLRVFCKKQYREIAIFWLKKEKQEEEEKEKQENKEKLAKEKGDRKKFLYLKKFITTFTSENESKVEPTNRDLQKLIDILKQDWNWWKNSKSIKTEINSSLKDIAQYCLINEKEVNKLFSCIWNDHEIEKNSIPKNKENNYELCEKMFEATYNQFGENLLFYIRKNSKYLSKEEGEELAMEIIIKFVEIYNNSKLNSIACEGILHELAAEEIKKRSKNKKIIFFSSDYLDKRIYKDISLERIDESIYNDFIKEYLIKLRKVFCWCMEIEFSDSNITITKEGMLLGFILQVFLVRLMGSMYTKSTLDIYPRRARVLLLKIYSENTHKEIAKIVLGEEKAFEIIKADLVWWRNLYKEIENFLVSVGKGFDIDKVEVKNLLGRI